MGISLLFFCRYDIIGIDALRFKFALVLDNQINMWFNAFPLIFMD